MDRLDLLFDSLLAETRLQRGLSIISIFISLKANTH